MSPAGFSGETASGAASPASGSSSGESGAATGTGKSVRKYAGQASGVVAGGQEDYGEHFSSVYCDLDTLKQALKKEFAGRALPGQPVTKSGKPYREFCYSQALVRVDDIHQADSVAAALRQMGYNAETNAEFLKSMKSQLAIIQAVLGGIGAVSLLVAAIGLSNTRRMTIYERAKETGCIVTTEEHSIMGGLGSAVAGFIGEHCPVPVVRHGVNDEFGRSGKAEQVLEAYGLTPAGLATKVKKALAMKA